SCRSGGSRTNRNVLTIYDTSDGRSCRSLSRGERGTYISRSHSTTVHSHRSGAVSSYVNEVADCINHPPTPSIIKRSCVTRVFGNRSGLRIGIPLGQHPINTIVRFEDRCIPRSV